MKYNKKIYKLEFFSKIMALNRDELKEEVRVYKTLEEVLKPLFSGSHEQIEQAQLQIGILANHLSPEFPKTALIGQKESMARDIAKSVQYDYETKIYKTIDTNFKETLSLVPKESLIYYILQMPINTSSEISDKHKKLIETHKKREEKVSEEKDGKKQINPTKYLNLFNDTPGLQAAAGNYVEIILKAYLEEIPFTEIPNLFVEKKDGKKQISYKKMVSYISQNYSGISEEEQKKPFAIRAGLEAKLEEKPNASH